MPDRLQPAAQPVGGGRRAVARAHAAVPAGPRRPPADLRQLRAFPAGSALARPDPVPRILPRRRGPGDRRQPPDGLDGPGGQAHRAERRVTTLEAHLAAGGGRDAAAVAALVQAMAAAGVRIADELARAALIGQLGTTGDTNVQGETVKKLDVWANDVVVEALDGTGHACTLVSEEMDEIRHSREACAGAGFVVCFDPVDGSSNLDVNGIVGTIFSVLKRRGEGAEHARTDILQPGTAQVAAGYIMYGPSTLLVMTTGDGVHGFTLDRSRGAYVRTHANLRIPARGKTYSINDGNFARWPDGVRQFVEHVRTVDVASGRPYTARYAGSLVTDVHRTLLEGGIY